MRTLPIALRDASHAADSAGILAPALLTSLAANASVSTLIDESRRNIDLLCPYNPDPGEVKNTTRMMTQLVLRECFSAYPQQDTDQLVKTFMEYMEAHETRQKCSRHITRQSEVSEKYAVLMQNLCSYAQQPVQETDPKPNVFNLLQDYFEGARRIPSGSNLTKLIDEAFHLCLEQLPGKMSLELYPTFKKQAEVLLDKLLVKGEHSEKYRRGSGEKSDAAHHASMLRKGRSALASIGKGELTSGHEKRLLTTALYCILRIHLFGYKPAALSGLAGKIIRCYAENGQNVTLINSLGALFRGKNAHIHFPALAQAVRERGVPASVTELKEILGDKMPQQKLQRYTTRELVSWTEKLIEHAETGRGAFPLKNNMPPDTRQVKDDKTRQAWTRMQEYQSTEQAVKNVITDLPHLFWPSRYTGVVDTPEYKQNQADRSCLLRTCVNSVLTSAANDHSPPLPDQPTLADRIISTVNEMLGEHAEDFILHSVNEQIVRTQHKINLAGARERVSACEKKSKEQGDELKKDRDALHKVLFSRTGNSGTPLAAQIVREGEWLIDDRQNELNAARQALQKAEKDLKRFNGQATGLNFDIIVLTRGRKLKRKINGALERASQGRFRFQPEGRLFVQLLEALAIHIEQVSGQLAGGKKYAVTADRAMSINAENAAKIEAFNTQAKIKEWMAYAQASPAEIWEARRAQLPSAQQPRGDMPEAEYMNVQEATAAITEAFGQLSRLQHDNSSQTWNDVAANLQLTVDMYKSSITRALAVSSQPGADKAPSVTTTGSTLSLAIKSVWDFLKPEPSTSAWLVSGASGAAIKNTDTPVSLLPSFTSLIESQKRITNDKLTEGVFNLSGQTDAVKNVLQPLSQQIISLGKSITSENFLDRVDNKISEALDNEFKKINPDAQLSQALLDAKIAIEDMKLSLTPPQNTVQTVRASDKSQEVTTETTNDPVNVQIADEEDEFILPESNDDILIQSDDERQISSFLSELDDYAKNYFGLLTLQQRERYVRLLKTSLPNYRTLNTAIKDVKNEFNSRIWVLTNTNDAMDSMMISTKRSDNSHATGSLWAWLCQGVPAQLAPPILTHDARQFIEHSSITMNGQPVLKRDGTPLTMQEVIAIGRESDVGQHVQNKISAWKNLGDTPLDTRREVETRFELTLLDEVKSGTLTSEEYENLKGLMNKTTDWKQLKVQGEAMPVYVLKLGRKDFVYMDVPGNNPLFIAKSWLTFDADQSALSVFGEEFRKNLWDTRKRRDGWSWTLLTPNAANKVNQLLPQPVGNLARHRREAERKNNQNRWLGPDLLYYNSEADYRRGANDVKLSPVTHESERKTFINTMVPERIRFLEKNVIESVVPNAKASLTHALRIGTDMLQVILDVILTPSVGKIKFPGRKQLLNFLFLKELAVDLPQNLVKGEWSDAGLHLTDVADALVSLKAHRAITKRQAKWFNRNYSQSTNVNPTNNAPLTAAARLRKTLPPALQTLNDDALIQIINYSDFPQSKIKEINEGRKKVPMSLAAATSNQLNSALAADLVTKLSTAEYLELDAKSESLVVAWIANNQNLKIVLKNPRKETIKVYAPESGVESRTVTLTRYDNWRYSNANQREGVERENSLFYAVQPERLNSEHEHQLHRMDAAARDLKREAAIWFNDPANQADIERGYHHGPRHRDKVPQGEGKLLPAHGTKMDGKLTGDVTRDVSWASEHSVKNSGSDNNLKQARYQRALAVIGGLPAKDITPEIEFLWMKGFTRLLTEKGLADDVAVVIKERSQVVSAWGYERAKEVLVLERTSNNGVFTYTGYNKRNFDYSTSTTNVRALSEILLHLMNDHARDKLEINIWDDAILQKEIHAQIMLLGPDQGTKSGKIAGNAPDESLITPYLQPVTLRFDENRRGVVHQDGQTWISWKGKALKVSAEGQGWRVLNAQNDSGPLLYRSYGHWRVIPEAQIGNEGAQRLGMGVKEKAQINGRYEAKLTQLDANSRFKNGKNNFENVHLPSEVESAKSALELKVLFMKVDNNNFPVLTPEQQGALSLKISKLEFKEGIQKSLHDTAVIENDWRKEGATEILSVPQDFVLPLAGEPNSGRCLPLVRGMAVALEKGTENHLSGKLFYAAAYHSDTGGISSADADKDVSLLKDALKNLHSNSEANRVTGEVRKDRNIDHIITDLSSSGGSRYFSLETNGHAMLVACKRTGGHTNYYFYDPNFGLATFPSTQKFKKALKHHFISRKLGEYYNAFGSQTNNPLFHLKEVLPEKMKDIFIGNGIKVDDLSNETPLSRVNPQ